MMVMVKMMMMMMMVAVTTVMLQLLLIMMFMMITLKKTYTYDVVDDNYDEIENDINTRNNINNKSQTKYY